MQESTTTNLDIFNVRDDGSELLLAAGLDTKEVAEVQEWWRYTKPLGTGIKIVVRSDLQVIGGFSTSGTEPGLPAEAHYPESVIAPRLSLD